MNLLERIRQPRPTRRPRADRDITLNEWLDYFSYEGLSYPILNQTLGSIAQERITPSASGFSEAALKRNGIIFACVATRALLFAQAQFKWAPNRDWTPGELFTGAELGLVQKPWRGATTQDLLTRMCLDHDLAGNAYVIKRDASTLRVARPEYMTVVLGSPRFNGQIGDVDTEIVGYWYQPPGLPGQVFLPENVAHWFMHPDPICPWRGMSWLQPVIEEIMADNATNDFRRRYFENSAAQPLDAKLATPDGWMSMGDIRVGDQVLGPDGAGRRVLGVYPQGEKQIYRITFSDGASTECCDDHVWAVASNADRKRGAVRLRTVRALRETGVMYDSGPAKWSVQLPDPVEYAQPDEDLPVDPYLLGLLLGDGSFRSNGKGSGGVSLAAGNDDADEIAALVEPALPPAVTLSRQDRTDCVQFYLKGPGGPRPNPMTTAVRELDLFDVIGHDKAIPERYMRALVADRVALLQGLVDSDGHVNKRPKASVRLHSTSERLVEQIRELVLSLGGRATIAQRNWALGSTAKPQWVLYFSRLPAWIVPCRLARKRAAYKPAGHRQPRHRYIVSIEPVAVSEARCIKVDAPDGLYLTDDFIVTHNTPNLVVKLTTITDPVEFDEWIDKFEEHHIGVRNAFKTLYLAGGADATVVGANLKDIDFRATQAHGETRMCIAARLPPILLGISEGLDSSTYSNFEVSMRVLANGTMRPMWSSVAGKLGLLLPDQSGAHLDIDPRLIPWLAEDQKATAEIQQLQAATIASLITAGFNPDAAVKAVMSGDLSNLQHTGLVSVQLLPPGVTGRSTPSPNGNGSAPAAAQAS
jgi:Phage portal protein/LAGLIDADG-like domain